MSARNQEALSWNERGIRSEVTELDAKGAAKVEAERERVQGEVDNVLGAQMETRKARMHALLAEAHTVAVGGGDASSFFAPCKAEAVEAIALISAVTTQVLHKYGIREHRWRYMERALARVRATDTPYGCGCLGTRAPCDFVLTIVWRRRAEGHS